MGNSNVGIIGCLYKKSDNNNSSVLIEPGTVILLRAGLTHTFYLIDNPKIIGSKTVDKFATIENAKWAFILSYYWKEAIETPNYQELDLWANLFGSGEGVKELGIGKQYQTGPSISITPLNDDVWLGYYYRMEVFSYTPGSGMNFDFLVFDKPKIRYAYFKKQNTKPELLVKSYNDGYYSYGEVIKLFFSTHLLPMKLPQYYHKKYGKIDSEESFENLKLEIFLTDQEGNRLLDNPIVSEKLSSFSTITRTQTSNMDSKTTTAAANLEFEVPIFIDHLWKDKFHSDSQSAKNYSVYILITNTKTKNSYDCKPDLKTITKIANSNREFDVIEVDAKFSVKYQSMDVILSENDADRKNMIQYIGDIEYNFAERNPCAYSIITVNDKIEIFNEYSKGKNIDKSKMIIGIVASDTESRNVKISLKFQESKETTPSKIQLHGSKVKGEKVKCEKILNDGQFHYGLDDVFKMDWIVGQWVPSEDPNIFKTKLNSILKSATGNNFFHPSKTDNIPVISWEKSDQEAKGIESPNRESYKNLTVSGIQGLTNDNFEYDYDNDSISLDMKYVYNRIVGEEIKKIPVSAILSQLWIFKYFNINKIEPQLYFVPISTCRYPNQIAKFHVYPDVNWGITFSIGAIDPKHKEDWRKDLTDQKKKVLQEYEGSFNFPSYNEVKIHEAEKKKKILQKLNLQFGFTASAGFETFDLTKNFGDKITNSVYSFGLIKEIFDRVVGNSEDSSQKEDRKLKYLKSAKKSKIFSALTKLPIEIEIGNPALSCGFSWGFRQLATEDKVTRSYDIFIKASPIISATGTLDLIALAGYIPVFGQAIKIVDIVLEASGADPSFFIEGKGKIEFGAKLKFGENDASSDGDLGFDGDFKIKVEASLTLQGGLVGYLFAAGDWKGDKITQYSGKGETGLTGVLKSGVDALGPYIDAKIEFAGLIFVAEKVEEDQTNGTSKKKKIGPYTVIEECTLIGNKYYFNYENEK